MSDTEPDVRIEHDSMGEVQVPAEALWGAQTARAVENFPISGQPVPPEVVHALALLKAAAAEVNAELGVVDRARAEAISTAAREVAAGEHDREFPVDVFQTGSGTSTNMNVNEVLARLAHLRSGLDVHPNDHVNAGQSSNDTFPSALRIAARSERSATSRPRSTISPCPRSQGGRVRRRRQGRADPPHGRGARDARAGVRRLRRQSARRRSGAGGGRGDGELPLGGTAAGTGLNAAPGFAAASSPGSPRTTGLPLREAADHFEAQSAQDAVVELSGALEVVAVSLTKICNDLRWMGSGPRTGLGEIHLPDLQPGSSIMPGKVNPVVPEATLMACAQVIGNDVTDHGGRRGRQLRAQRHAAGHRQERARVDPPADATSRLLADRCIDGITAEVEHARTLAEGSPSIVTPLNRYIGYEAAAAVVKQAVKEQRTSERSSSSGATSPTDG